MTRYATAVLAALVLTDATPAIAKPTPTDLPRVGKWELNYDKDSCSLFGKFGTGKDEIIAQFTRSQPSDGMGLRLYGQSLKVEGQFIPFEVDFGPLENPQKLNALVGSSGSMPMAVFGGVRLDDWSGKNFWDVGPPITPQYEATVTTLTIKAPTGKWYRLALGRMDTPMVVMRRCTSDLIRSWGFDPVVMSSLKSGPVPVGSPANWINSSDYPAKMLAKRGNAIINFRLDIGVDGTVTGCIVTQQTGEAEFADTTCRLLTKRGKFRPALDAEGKPTRSYFISAVRWAVPG